MEALGEDDGGLDASAEEAEAAAAEKKGSVLVGVGSRLFGGR